MTFRRIAVLSLAAALAACASAPLPPAAPPTPFVGEVAAISTPKGRPLRVHLMFAEVFPDGRLVAGEPLPATRWQAEGAWMWDLASMTIDAFERSGVEVVADKSQADVTILYELVSRTPDRLRPVGFAAPDSATAIGNTALDLVTFGIASKTMVGYVNADLRARVRTPEGEKVHSLKMAGATAPFSQNDFNLDWRKEAFAKTRAMYLPMFNDAVAQMVASLKPTLENASS